MTKRLVLSVLLLVGMLGSVAFADVTTVTYFTTHTFAPDPSLGLSFEDQSTKSTDVLSNSFSNTTLGTFVISQTEYASVTYVNVPFTLTVNQINPSAGPGTFDADIFGTIYHNGSTAYVEFGTPSVQIGNVVYTLTSEKYTLNANDGEQDGRTTIQAAVTVVPEPGSLALLGSGLLGMGGFLRRRFFA